MSDVETSSSASSRYSPVPRYSLLNSQSSVNFCGVPDARDSVSESSPLLGHRAATPQPATSCSILEKATTAVKVSILASVVIVALVTSGLTKEAATDRVSVAFNGSGSAFIDVEKHGLSFSHPKLHIRAMGPFLAGSSADSSEAFAVFELVRRLPNGSHETLEGVPPLRVPVAQKKTATQDAPCEIKHEFPSVLSNKNLGEPMGLELLIRSEGLALATPISVLVTPLKEIAEFKLVMALVILTGLYVLIIFEICDRTLAAMLAASAAIACMALMGARPNLEQIVLWIDFETLNLLFGMMVIVAVIGDTGVFDYLSDLAFKFARGEIWKSITMLCISTAIVSAFLDNVTVILLMTPVTIKLCKALDLDPTQVLIILVMFSNIGGAATPVGDPPNAIIISNSAVMQSGINFLTFTIYLLPGVIAGGIGAYVGLRLYFWDAGSLRYRRIQEEIELSESCGKSFSPSLSLEEDFERKLRTLSEEFRIRDRALLMKSSLVLAVVIALFFLQPILELNLSPGLTAVFGALALLVLANKRDLGEIIERVEWATLLFFAALFVVMEALAELGLLQFLGEQTEACIMSVDEEYRLICAVVFVMWVSALASSFIDNIPFTTVMVKIVGKLGEVGGAGLPVRPLVCALAFGACFGGNGTLIGASANVVCAGVAEQHGYRLTFTKFFKIGFFVMIISTSMATGWMLILTKIIS